MAAPTRPPTTVRPRRSAGTRSPELDQGREEPGARSGAEGSGATLDRALMLMMAMLGFLIGSQVIADNSFFTHFATGNVILSSGSVPTVDPYSFTAAGESWTVQSWLPSVVYRGLYELSGLWAVRIFNGILAAALAAGLWRLSAPARSLLPRVGLCGVAVLIGPMMWSPRPLLVGLTCLLAVVMVVEHNKAAWWLLPTMWVWVNSHGSFPLAFAFIGAVGVGHWLDTRTLPRNEIRLFGWAAGGLALAAVNPVGPKLLYFPFQLLSRNEALEDVSEWASPSFSRPSEWAFLVLLLALVVSAKLGAKWRHLLPALGFFVMGLLAVRNINPAAIVMVAGAAPALALVPGTLDGQTRSFAARLMAATAVVVAIVAAVTVFASPALDLDRYPVEEVDWLEERDLVADPAVNLVHREIAGNYLELRYGADANVFMDDRYDFFPLAVIDDHSALYFGGEFAEILDRHDADAVLWNSEGLFADWLRSGDFGWSVVFEGENWIVALPSQAS